MNLYELVNAAGTYDPIRTTSLAKAIKHFRKYYSGEYVILYGLGNMQPVNL